MHRGSEKVHVFQIKYIIIMTKVRAKFSCNSVDHFPFGYKTARFSAIYSEKGENKDFTESTPSGTLEISISGKTKAANFFEPGNLYYLDFTEAPAE